MTDQTVADNLGASVRKLKAALEAAARAAVADFRAETGLTPSGLDVRMMETTCAGDAVRQYTVGEVTVDLGRLRELYR